MQKAGLLAAAVIAVAVATNACRDTGTDRRGAGVIAPPARRSLIADITAPRKESAIATLSALRREDYRTLQEVSGHTLRGVVTAAEDLRGDSSVTPADDRTTCKPFTDVFMPRKGKGVGNAVVWVSGISAGKPNTLPMRTSIRLRKCRLEPRIRLVAAGGTVIVGSDDAMESRLRIFDALTGPGSKDRAVLPFNDFGQVIPVTGMTEAGGLFEVRDDMHPWVHGFIAASAHPYITVTDAGGAFVIDSLPAGSYEIVAFSETLGTVRRRLRIPSDSSVELSFD